MFTNIRSHVFDLGSMPSSREVSCEDKDSSVLRSMLAILISDNKSSRSSSGRCLSKRSRLGRKKKRRSKDDYNDDVATVDLNDDTHLSCDIYDQLSQQSLAASIVDILYDAKDRLAQEALMDEDLIPIGLEPDDSVMLESFEVLMRPDGEPSSVAFESNDDTTTLKQHYPVSLECQAHDGVYSSNSCSSFSTSQGQSIVTMAKAAPAQPEPESPKASDELPIRFLRAAKGNQMEGKQRYEDTLTWRRDNRIDDLLFDAWPAFELTKQHYPHFFHGRGRQGQPVFYEQPPKTDLRALRAGGIGVEQLLRYYAMITEYQWQLIDRDDLQRSIYIIDLAGIRMTDFVGECVDFVRQASAFTSAHYPERAGHVFVVNVPGWFKMIWNVVKPMIDEVTLEKIHILRGQQEIYEALEQQIAPENIPQEYGGKSRHKLGESPEEELLRDLMKHNNDMAQNSICPCAKDGPSCCRFCNMTLARHY